MKIVTSSEICKIATILEREIIAPAKVSLYNNNAILKDSEIPTTSIDDFIYTHLGTFGNVVVETIMSESGNRESINIDMPEILGMLIDDLNELYDCFCSDAIDMFEEWVTIESASELGVSIIDELKDAMELSFTKDQELWENTLLNAVAATTDLLEVWGGVTIGLSMESLVNASYDYQLLIIGYEDAILKESVVAEYSDGTIEQILTDHNLDEMGQSGGFITVNDKYYTYRPYRETLADDAKVINAGDVVNLYILKEPI